MAVPARTNKSGTFGYNDNMVQTTTSTKASDGSIVTSQVAWVQAVHNCQKSALIKTRPTPTTSFAIPFRTPTTFDRGVREVKYNSGIWEKFATGVTYNHVVQEGPPDVKASWSMLGCPPLMTGNLVSIDTNLRNQARTECLLRLKDARVNFAENLGEARSTVNMLADRSRQLLRIVDDLRHKRWSRIPHNFLYRFGQRGNGAKEVSNLYLELKYGWLPLMSDIYGLYQLSLDQTKVGTIIRKSREVFDNQSFDNKVIYTGWSSTCNGRRSHKCVLYAVVDNAKVRNWNRAGVTNPLATTWQLSRLSFVVDWMVPIGNWLECLTANWGVEFLGGYDSQWCEYRSEATLLPTGGYTELSPKSAEMDAFSFRRQRLTSFPAPVPYIKSPFTGGHVASALALFHQLGM